MMKKTALLLLSTALVACNQLPKEAYYNRGAPESLLDLSLETVNIDLSSPSAIDELVGWVNQDQPSRAEIRCRQGRACSKARDVFDQFAIPVKEAASDENTVVLVYERVLARDCDNHYIDNSINPYNLNHPTFGCSMSANMVQMVSDKRQFISPNLLDFHDGEKAVQAYRAYQQPSAQGGEQESKSAIDSIAGN